MRSMALKIKVLQGLQTKPRYGLKNYYGGSGRRNAKSSFTRWLNCGIMAIIPILSDRDRAESGNKVGSLSECCC